MNLILMATLSLLRDVRQYILDIDSDHGTAQAADMVARIDTAIHVLEESLK